MEVIEKGNAGSMYVDHDAALVVVITLGRDQRFGSLDRLGAMEFAADLAMANFRTSPTPFCMRFCSQALY